MARPRLLLLPAILVFFSRCCAQSDPSQTQNSHVSSLSASYHTQSSLQPPSTAVSDTASLTTNDVQSSLTTQPPTEAPSSSRPSLPPSTATTSSKINLRHSSVIPTITSIANHVSVVIPTSATATPTGISASLNPQLPIHPAITPGLSIAGIVLIILGMIYALVGIRNRSIYIALGSTFLTSLAVTVLIVYVASPPISDAVQGAYFVAAFLTGVILGGLSLIFKEITEPLGCIFGGFCLAMWFLCLKSGGLLTSQGSRIALIAAFSVAIMAASMVKITRSYATIGSSAFAGATVLLLGIDCFSRAGLKEFWLYIWGLNSSLFPLGTKTYPLARGIQAELACIIVVFLFGLMSQARLWKIVRQKRSERDLERLRGERAIDHIETTIGRRIESTANRERAVWEAIYAQQDAVAKGTSDYQSTTTSASLPKVSASFREYDKSAKKSVELVDLDRAHSRAALAANSGGSSQRASIIVRVADESKESGYMTHQLNKQFSRPGSVSPVLIEQASRKDTWSRDSPGHRPVSALKTKNITAAAPVVVPLPFSVPENEVDHDDAVSMATIAETDDRAYDDLAPKGFNELPEQPRSDFEEDFAVDIPHIEDDRASSLAATLDDLTEDGTESLRNLSIKSLVFEDLPAEESPNPAAVLRRVSSFETSTKTEEASKLENGPDNRRHSSDSHMHWQPSGVSSIEAATKDLALGTNTSKTQKSSHKRLSLSINRLRSSRLSSPIELPQQPPTKEAFEEQLKGKISKVTLSYRTNEWAKHLETAEIPSVDDINADSTFDMQAEPRLAEIPAPVQIDDLKQGMAGLDSKYIPRTASMTSNTNPFRAQIVDRSASDPVISRISTQTPVTPSRSSSSASLHANPGVQRPGSQLSMRWNQTDGVKRASSQPLAYTRGLRNDRTPIIAQTLVESPVEEAQADMFRATSRATMTGSKGNPAFIPFMANQNMSVIQPNDSTLTRNASFDDDNMSLLSRKRLIDAENISLAKQRDMILQQQYQQAQQLQMMEAARQNNWQFQQNPIYDSHQPQRNVARDEQKRHAMLATWRESVRQDLNPAQFNLPDEGRRNAMLSERRQAQFALQQQAAAANYRETMFDNMMRQGSVLDLHQEAMRRMQAQAQAEANGTP